MTHMNMEFSYKCEDRHRQGGHKKVLFSIYIKGTIMGLNSFYSITDHLNRKLRSLIVVLYCTYRLHWAINLGGGKGKVASLMELTDKTQIRVDIELLCMESNIHVSMLGKCHNHELAHGIARKKQ